LRALAAWNHPEGTCLCGRVTLFAQSSERKLHLDTASVGGAYVASGRAGSRMGYDLELRVSGKGKG